MSHTSTAQDPQTDWDIRHTHREQARRSPSGFFAVTGLYWLNDQPTQVTGLPGTWYATTEGPAVSLTAGENLLQEDTELNGDHTFTTVATGSTVNLTVPAGQSPTGVTTIEVGKRGQQYMLRPKSATHPFLTAYAGTSRFDHSLDWRIPGTFIPAEQAKQVAVPTAVEGLESLITSPGTVRFTAGDQQQELIAFGPADASELMLLFTDETSGDTTYHALRTLRVAVEDNNDVVLDFNQSSNLPCAYTDLATCPLPPAGNHINAAVTAGEQKPTQRITAAPDGIGLAWDRIAELS